MLDSSKLCTQSGGQHKLNLESGCLLVELINVVCLFRLLVRQVAAQVLDNRFVPVKAFACDRERLLELCVLLLQTL